MAAVSPDASIPARLYLQPEERHVLVQGMIFIWSPVCPEFQLGFIWETRTLCSVPGCLCSGLCLGCIMWQMSSRQSAVGTRTCSGNPEADWRLANREDAMTSGGDFQVPNQPVNYASGHTPAVGTSATACLDLEEPKNAPIPRVPADGWCGCACENFVPSGFRLSCLSTPCANITAGRWGCFSADSETCIFPSVNVGKHTTNVPSMQYYCNPPTPLPCLSLIAPLYSLHPSPPYLCPIFPYLF